MHMGRSTDFNFCVTIIVWQLSVDSNLKMQGSESVSHSVVSDSLRPHVQSMEFSRPEYWNG